MMPGYTRRRVIRGAAALGGGLLASAAGAAGQDLALKGVCYDTGTAYVPGSLSRAAWHPAAVRRDLRIIREALHCNAVSLFGTDHGRLAEAAEAAAAAGLQVGLQPRLVEAGQDAALDHLAETARIAEALRARGAAVTLSLGCELTLFTAGFLPGATFFDRMAAFGTLSADGFTALSVALNNHLARARTAARSRFRGPVTYAAGPWEDVDWSDFDLIGLDHYRDASNRATYVEELHAFRRWGKPVVVAEFGCCAYEGAEDAGGDGWSIVDWTKPVPELKGAPVRSERVQAETIGELIGLYRAEGIAGAFVYQFIDTGMPHSPDPRRDLDMAGYGLVRVDEADSGDWTPKQAFRTVAELYGQG